MNKQLGDIHYGLVLSVVVVSAIPAWYVKDILHAIWMAMQ